MENRVVVTGLGVASSLGCDPETVYENAINGVCKIKVVEGLPEELKVKIASPMDESFDPLKYIKKRDVRRMDKFAQYAVYAANQAYEDAGLNPDVVNAEDFGVIIGSGMGGMRTFADDLHIAWTKGINKIPPMFVPMIIPNMAAGNVAIALDAQNHCSCTSTACSAGTNAIGDAFEWIKMGRAKVMAAGGSEAGVGDLTLSGFNALTALSRNPDPLTACRPFDLNRDGFVLGEGAGVLILEELEHAKARGAKIYAEVVGYGSMCDAHHITAPSGKGAVNGIKQAIKEANIQPSDIDYINAHGTSTPINDVFETNAIKEVFGEDAYNVSISSTKSMHGHALGGAGGIESLLTVKTIENGIIPPTINYQTPDPECDLDYTPNVAKKRDVTYAMNNSLGFGGHNAFVIFRKYGE